MSRFKKLWLFGLLVVGVAFAGPAVVFGEPEFDDPVTITYVVSEEPLDGLEASIEAPAPVTGERGRQVVHIPTLSSSVYTFLGWYSLDDEGNPVQHRKYDVIDEDLTLYGAWRLTPRVVSYDLDGGTNSPLNPVIVFANQTYTLEDATLFGYNFEGWLLDDTIVTELTGVTASLSLTATWAPVTGTMTLELENGEDDVLVPFTFDEAYSLEAPTRIGYDFAGWLDQDDAPFAAEGIVDFVEDITLTAQWTPRGDTAYQVQLYDQNLAGDYVLVDTLDLTGETDSTVTYVPTVPTGFVLNTEESILEGVVAADGSLVLEVYFDREVYTVTFLDELDEVLAIEPVMFEGAATAPAYEAPEGFSFIEWDTEFAVVTEDLTVSPLIEANTYTITFQVGDDVYATLEVTFGEEIGTFPANPEAPVDKVFNAWRDADNNVFTEDTVYLIAGDLTLFAEFVLESDVNYTIEYAFENEDGEFVVDPSLTQVLVGTAGDTVTAPGLVEVPEGFVLKGELPSGQITTADGGLVLTVQYERIVLTVTFEYYENDLLVTEDVDVKYGLTVVAPILDDRTGYDFVGWDADLDNITEAQTITALYEAIEYSIDYELNDDDFFDVEAVLEDPVSSYTIEDETIILPEPTLAGFVFAGWFDNAELEGDAVTEVPAGSTGNVTVYAKWTPITYDVTFVDGETTVVLEVEIGTTVDEGDFPEVDAPEGQALLGWFYVENGSQLEFTSQTPVNRDYTLTPQFAPVATITFDSQDGSLVEPLTEIVGMPIEAPEEPTRENFVFTGWFLDEAATEAYDFTTMPVEDLTLYAGWEAVEPASWSHIENFDNYIETGSSYSGTDSFIGVYSVEWFYNDTRGDQSIDGKSLMLRNNTSSFIYGYFPEGISSFAVDYTNAFSSPAQLDLYINGVLIETSEQASGEVKVFLVQDIDMEGVVKLELRVTNGIGQTTIDNLRWTSYGDSNSTAGLSSYVEEVIALPDETIEDISLITSLNVLSKWDINVDWSSSDETVIDSSSGVTTRPAAGEPNATITMIATINDGNGFLDSIEFDIIVLAETDIDDEPSWDATQFFENEELPGGYGNGTYEGVVDFDYVHARDDAGFDIDGGGLLLRRSDEPSSITFTLEDGLDALYFEYRKAYTGGATRTYEVHITHDGGTDIYAIPAFGSGTGRDDTIHEFLLTDLVLEGFVTITIKAVGSTGNQQAVFNNISWNNYEDSN